MITAFVLSGCTPALEESPAQPQADTSVPEQGSTELPATQPSAPTGTVSNLPMAARINGEGILLEEYEAELLRYADAMAELGKPVDPEEQRQAVLSELIDQTLLAQAAVSAGFTLDDAALEERIAELGDAQALADWLARHNYTDESFRLALRRQAAVANQRDRITSAVPEAVEQVKARQILVFDQALAERLHNRLKDGADFATLARQIDPTGGELGWFPRGYLTLPEIEDTAFALQPGQYSDVIVTSFGYHIVQTTDRSAAQPVSADVRRFLQHRALSAWLEEQRSVSEIEILLP